MATKLVRLYVSKVHYEELFGLAQNIVKLFPLLASATEVKPVVDDYIANFNALDLVISPVRKSSWTNDVVEANKARDVAVSGLRFFLKSLLCDATLSKKDLEVAENLNNIFKAYGNPNKASNLKKTGIIKNMLDDLTAVVGYDTIGAKHWTDQLESAQKQFNDLYLQRMDDVAVGKLPKGATRAAMVALTASHRQLTNVVNGLVELNPTVYEPFIKQANEAIVKVNNDIKARITRSKQRRETDAVEE